MDNLQEQLLITVSEIYSKPKTIQETIPGNWVTKTRTIEVEERVMRVRDEKVPSVNLGNNVLIATLAFAIFFCFIYWPAAIVTAIIGTVAGIYLRKNRTKTLKVEVEELVNVPKEVTYEEQAPPETIEHVIPNPLRINRIGLVNLQFQISQVGKSLILHSDDLRNNLNFSFPVLKDPVGFKNQFDEKRKEIIDIPDILEGVTKFYDSSEESEYGEQVPLRGYENELFDYLAYVRDAIRAKQQAKVALSVMPDSALVPFLVARNGDTMSGSILQDLMDGDNGESLDHVLEEWLKSFPRAIDQINDVRNHSLDKVLSKEFYALGQTSHFSSFNFYCPDCNRDIMAELLNKDYSVQEIPSDQGVNLSRNTRCYFNPEKSLWNCPICGKEHREPIPVHKSLDEIFLPAYDKLMEEHKVERDKKTSATRTLELEYRKELKTKVGDVSYQSLNDVLTLEDEMDQMKAEVGGHREAIDYMNRIAGEFRNISSALLDKIQRETAGIEMNIQIKSQDVLRKLEEYKNREIGKYNEEMNRLSRAKRLDDERREAIMVETVTAIRSVEGAVKENTAVTKASGDRVVGAVQENTAVTQDVGQQVVGAVKENTQVTRETGDKVVGAVKETTAAVKQGNEIQTKSYGIAAATARQQGYDIDNYGILRIDKNLGKAFTNMKSTVTGRSAAEREIELIK